MTKTRLQKSYHDAIGKVFKDLRMSKRMGQKEASGTELSVQQLSHFETGQGMISADKFLSLLENLNVDGYEFEKALNSHLHLYDTITFNAELAECHMTRDISRLETLLKEIQAQQFEYPKRKKHRLFQIRVLSELTHLDPQNYQVPSRDINFLKAYFLQLNDWGRSDIGLFNQSVDLFDTVTIKRITDQMLRPSQSNLGLFPNQYEMVQTVIHVIDFCIDQRPIQEKLARQYIDFLKNWNIHEYHMYDKLLLLFNEAKLDYLTSDAVPSLEKLEKYLEIFKFCDCPKTAQMLSDEIEQLTETKTV